MQEMEEILKREEKEERLSVWISVVTRRGNDTQNSLSQSRWSDLNDCSTDLAEADSSGETRTNSQTDSTPSQIDGSSTASSPSPGRDLSEIESPENTDGDRPEAFTAARQRHRRENRPDGYDSAEPSSYHATDRFSDPGTGSDPGDERPFDPVVLEEPVPVVTLDIERMELDLGGEPGEIYRTEEEMTTEDLEEV